MGILDDAIRQHLELKRQHGAGDEDLDRLEKEAFGPAARPGDPDFVDPDVPAEGEAPSEEEPAVEAPSEERPFAEAPSEEMPSAEAPSEELAGVDGETAAERARIEHANLDDTADHPAPTQLGPESEAEPTPREHAPSAQAPSADVTEPVAAEAPPSAEEPVEAPESGIFNAEDFDFGDLDLELEDEEPSAEQRVVAEPPSAGQPVVDEAPSAEQPAAAEPEHVSEEAPVEPEPASEEQPVESSSTQDWAAPPAEPEAASPEGDGDAEEGEDLLEETPDFLQETEGEDLWFEQGPPRDFDFDDD